MKWYAGNGVLNSILNGNGFLPVLALNNNLAEEKNF